jgi:AraC-like DNA-binding protein
VRLSEGLIPVGRLVSETGLSQRHLSRKFQEYVGLSPKEYLRVSRFIHSLDHLKRYPVFSLTEVAYKSGYYDQAHFIRDYKDYTGYTPGQVVRAWHILY